MKKRINKRLTVRRVNIITFIITAIMLMLLTIFLIVDVSKDGLGAVIVSGMTGLSYVFCISASCWIILYSNIDECKELRKK